MRYVTLRLQARGGGRLPLNAPMLDRHCQPMFRISAGVGRKAEFIVAVNIKTALLAEQLPYLGRSADPGI